jgi:hypothetical protein
MAGLASEMLAALQMHEEIFRYWKGLRARRCLPSRADLDLVHIRKLLPTISLIDVLEEKPNNNPALFKQRLAGTGLYSAYGVEITGKTLDEIYHEAEAKYWAEELSLVVKTKKPNVGLHSLAWRGVEGLSLFWLRLPLSNNGTRVDMILGHDALIGKQNAPVSGIRAA